MKEFGNLILCVCKKNTSTENDTLLVLNRDSGAIDVLQYYISGLDIYNGALIAGESISNNTMTLFSGNDDQDSEIDNYWESKLDNFDVENLKVAKRSILEGNIGPDQEISLFVSIDNGSFVEVLDDNGGAFIQGNGSYVDKTQNVDVGAYTLGRGEIGGGGDGISAYHYMRELKINQDKFYQIKIRFKTNKIGYASISQYQWKDVRIKPQKLPTRYRG